MIDLPAAGDRHDEHDQTPTVYREEDAPSAHARFAHTTAVCELLREARIERISHQFLDTSSHPLARGAIQSVKVFGGLIGNVEPVAHKPRVRLYSSQEMVRP